MTESFFIYYTKSKSTELMDFGNSLCIIRITIQAAIKTEEFC